MAFKIVVSDTVGVKVKGTMVDAAGISQPFDFTLFCNRLDADTINAKLKNESESSITDFMAEVTTGWQDVRGDGNAAIDFNPTALRQMFNIPGIPALAFRAYMSDVGAKEKN
jgi:hypothetical protein